MNEWINLKDKLPEGPGNIVIVKTEKGQEIKAYYHRDKAAWAHYYREFPWSHFQDFNNYNWLTDVTHWKPLTKKSLIINTSKYSTNEIIFNADLNGSWVMRLTSNGIFFNRKQYNDACTDDFTKEVIKILEKEFCIKFERKEEPHNRNS